MTDRSAEISKINDENQEEDKELFNSLDEIISQNIDEIDGVVISFPEKINSKNGIAHTARAFMWICDLALKSILDEKYSQPVWILMNNLGDYSNKCYYDKELDLVMDSAYKKVYEGKIETNKTT